MRKKNTQFIWTCEQQKAFDMLKDKIANLPILRIPDFNEKIIIQTDASGSGVSAVLSQKSEGILLPVAFSSRTLNDNERKYSEYELECLAVVFGIEKFRSYLDHCRFLLLTDNQALSWLLNNPRLSVS